MPNDSGHSARTKPKAQQEEVPRELLTLAADVVGDGTEKPKKPAASSGRKAGNQMAQSAATEPAADIFEQRSPLRNLYSYNVTEPIEDGEWADEYDAGQYDDELYAEHQDMWYYGPPVRYQYGPMSMIMTAPATSTVVSDNEENVALSGTTAADALLVQENSEGVKAGGEGDPDDLFDGYRDRFEEETGPQWTLNWPKSQTQFGVRDGTPASWSKPSLSTPDLKTLYARK